MSGDISRFRIGFENYAFERPEDRIALVTGTVAGGSLSTLRAQQLSRQVTVASDAEGDIVLRWQGGTVSEPEARSVQLVALSNVEVEIPGGAPYLRLQVSRYLGGTLIDSQTVEYDWWQATSAKIRFLPNVVCLFNSAEDCDRVDIRLHGGSATARTARIGPAWVGPVWAPDPQSGLEPGWAVTPSDTGTVRRTASSAAVTRKRRVLRQFGGSLALMPYSAAFGRDTDAAPETFDLQHMLHTIGTTRLVYVLPRTVTAPPASAHTYAMFRLGFIGLCAQLGTIAREQGDYYRWDGFQFSEVQ
jgi:hypothetical protein